ncbi:flagellar protein FlgN [Bacillus sp. FJAT-42376]|uniref:flagellar protein FlgN n=1 Tax=Bacillus sp. FJAT-42376 TaxID=2014076 RepID=UPI000F51185B|nr:flagellar protein FlgN [Bacillus sp. FJAT-42376]AZB44540.1 flagellar protein FlgN [Bacillus sp. FJAT-42376]
MQAGTLILTLERLLELHLDLYQTALKKTDQLKHNQMDELKQVLQQEQVLVQVIKQTEAERMTLASQFLGRHTDLTLAACAEKAEGAEKERLSELKEEFKEVMDKLKAANQLNQQMTQSALQFVTMSLDMLMPREQVPNYQRPDTMKKNEPNRRSLFDSKA